MKDWRDEKKKTTTATEDFKKNLMYGKRYVDKTPLLASLLEIDHETTFFLRFRGGYKGSSIEPGEPFLVPRA